MKDVGEHKNLGVGVVGDLKKKKPTNETKKKPKANKKLVQNGRKQLSIFRDGTVNAGTRTTKAEYLRHNTKTVGIINVKGEYEVVPTKQCGEGDVVWVLEDNGTFTKTKIY